MNLTASATKWILFLGSSGVPEERHLLDLAFGVFCLEKIGISQNNISIYIDGNDRELISQLISNGTSHNYTIYRCSDFFSNQDTDEYENIVLFITGHGSIEGIDGTPSIKPYTLLNSIKKHSNLKTAIVYLGQCHAGIFNYISAGEKRDSEGNITEPNVILMGATNLHESISASTQENLATGTFTWVANLFLLYIFKWITNPIDVDGDGKTTVMDSYKYAGVLSNQAKKTINMQTFVGSLDFHPRWISAKKDLDTTPSATTQLAFDALNMQYSQMLGVRYTHQECWILNAIPAQQIEY